MGFVFLNMAIILVLDSVVFLGSAPVVIHYHIFHFLFPDFHLFSNRASFLGEEWFSYWSHPLRWKVTLLAHTLAHFYVNPPFLS
jgi:hypothetical protein